MPATIEPLEEAIRTLYLEINPPKEPTATRKPAAPLHQSDSDLLAVMFGAKNGHRVKALWDGDSAGYASASEADYALVAHLAFYAQGDERRIDSLFKQSGRYTEERAEKWDRLGPDTIKKVVAGTTEFYKPPMRADSFNGFKQNGTRPSPGSETSEAEERSLIGFPLTDTGNAERLVLRHGSDLRYTHEAEWMAWNGQHWFRDTTGETERRAKETLRALEQEAWATSHTERQAAILKFAAQSEGLRRRQAMITLAASESAVRSRLDAFDRNPMLFNVQNGTLDLETGKLREHCREDHITKLAPVPYDSRADCSRWEDFILEIMGGDEELSDFLRRAVGYSLTGLTNEQVLFILYGIGSNGKSTFLEILRAMLGDYAQQANPEAFQERKNDTTRNDLAKLAGARMVSAVEVKSGRRLDEELIKQATGGDVLTARFLYKEFFEFAPTFKLFLAANNKPIIRGTDKGIWRRPRMIPFTVSFSIDKSLKPRLLSELPGILAWAVRGCLEWNDKGLSPPDSVLAATENYRLEMDILAGFLEGCCVTEPSARVLAKELYAAYTQWCGQEGEQSIPTRAFCQMLQERGFDRQRSGTGGNYRWHGIGLVDYYARE